MAFATREVAYRATISGFDRAEKVIEDTDKALDGAADGADEAAQAFSKAGAAAGRAAGPLNAAGDGVKKAGEEAKKAANPLDAFEKGVGQLSKIVGGFGLVALPGAIDGVIALTERVWGWTDAGQEATRMQEAQAAAVQQTVDKLVAMEALITKVSGKDIVAYTRATREQAKIQAELTEAIDEQIEAEDKLNRGRAASSRSLMKEGSAELAEATKRVDELREAYARVDLVVRDFDDRRVFESADDLRGRIAATADEQRKATEEAGKAAERAASKAARAAEKAARDAQKAMADGLREALASLDAFVQQSPPVFFEDDTAGQMAEKMADDYVLGGHKIRAELAAVQAEAERVAAAIFDAWSDGPTSALQQFGQGIAQQIAAAILLGDSVEEAAARALEALAAQAFGEALFQAAAALAALGKGLVTYDPLAFAAAKAHAASAAAFAAIAGGAALGASALGGGGGGGGEPPKSLGDAERERTTSAGGNGSSGPSVTNNSFNFAGSLLNTERDFQRLVRGALKDSESATGLPRPDFKKIGAA